MVIKSQEALDYLKDFAVQCPEDIHEGDVCVTAFIWYRSRRSDLSVELLLDAMEGKLYHNDRQVKRLICEKDLDKENPRCIVKVEPYENVKDNPIM